MNCKYILFLVEQVDKYITQIDSDDLALAKSNLVKLNEELGSPIITTLINKIDYLRELGMNAVHWLSTWQSIKRALQVICSNEELLVPRNELIKFIEELIKKAQ